MNEKKRQLLRQVFSNAPTVKSLSAYMYDLMINNYKDFSDMRTSILEFYDDPGTADDFILNHEISDTAILLDNGDQTTLYDVLHGIEDQRDTEEEITLDTASGECTLSYAVESIGNSAVSYTSILAGFDYLRREQDDSNTNILNVKSFYPELQVNDTYFNQVSNFLTDPSISDESKFQTLMSTMDGEVEREDNIIFIDVDSSLFSGKSPIAAWFSQLSWQIDWDNVWNRFLAVFYGIYVVISGIVEGVRSLFSWLGQYIWDNTVFKVDLSTKHGQLNIPLRQQIISLTNPGPFIGIGIYNTHTPLMYLGEHAFAESIDDNRFYNYENLCPENTVLVSEFRFGMCMYCRKGSSLNVVFVPYLCSISDADAMIPRMQMFNHNLGAYVQRMAHCGKIFYQSYNDDTLFVYGNTCFDNMLSYHYDKTGESYINVEKIFSYLYSTTMSTIDFDVSSDFNVAKSLLLSCYRFDVLIALLATDDDVVNSATSTPLWGYDDQLNVAGYKAAQTVAFLENVLGYGFMSYSDEQGSINPSAADTYNFIASDPSQVNKGFLFCSYDSNFSTLFPYIQKASAPVFTVYNYNVLLFNGDGNESTASIICEFNGESYGRLLDYPVSICPYSVEETYDSYLQYLFPQFQSFTSSTPTIGITVYTSTPIDTTTSIVVQGHIMLLYYSFYNSSNLELAETDRLSVISSSMKPVNYDDSGVILLTDAYQAAQFKSFLIGLTAVTVAITAAVILHRSIVSLQTAIIKQSAKVDSLFFKANSYEVGSQAYLDTMKQASQEASKLRGKTALANALGISVPGAASYKSGIEFYSGSGNLDEVISLIKG